MITINEPTAAPIFATVEIPLLMAGIVLLNMNVGVMEAIDDVGGDVGDDDVIVIDCCIDNTVEFLMGSRKDNNNSDGSGGSDSAGDSGNSPQLRHSPNPSEIQGNVQIGSWLLRLFQSDFFDARLALHYLHLYPNNRPIQSYICNAFNSFPEADCEFWLPQLIHILITRGGVELETFVANRALDSDHMAIMGPRLSSSNPDAQELLQRVYQKTQSILFGRSAALSSSTFASPVAQSPLINDPRFLNANAESIITIKPNSSGSGSTSTTAPPLSSKELQQKNKDGSSDGSNNDKRTTSPESEGSSAGFFKVDSAHVTHVNATGDIVGEGEDEASLESSVSSSTDHIGGLLNSSGTSGIDHMKESVIFVGNNSRGASGVIVGGGELFGLGSVAFDKDNKFAASSIGFPMSAPSIEEMGMGTAFNRTVKFAKRIESEDTDVSANMEGSAHGQISRPSDVEWMMVHKPDYSYLSDPRMRYFHSQLQFIMTLSDISDRLRSVPKPARQSALCAELSLLNHNLPANVCIPLWCHGGVEERHHHWIVRVPPNDAVTLNSADRVPYLLLLEVVDEIEDEFPDIDVTISEMSLNCSGEKRLENKLIAPLRTNSDTETGSVRQSTSSINIADQGANSEENAEYYKSVINRRHQMSPAASTVEDQTAEITVAPIGMVVPRASSASLSSSPKQKATISRSRSTSSSLALHSAAVDEYTQKMRTAAVMLAQLYKQEAAGPTNTSSPSGSNSPSPNRKADPSGHIGVANVPSMKVDYEAIRNRLVQEMSILEEKRYKALEGQKASGKTAASGSNILLGASNGQIGQDDAVPEGIEEQISAGLLKKDKDDPSAAVFKESWDAKCARVRATSPYGSNPSWRLISAIVKSGSDLRQEVLALQLIKEMQRIWDEEKVPVWVHYYRILVTSKDGGYNQHLNTPGVAYTLYDHFIKEFGAPASKKFLKAQDAFMRSLAGYSIVCYLLQIKDRHNGNILVDKDGHTIHIDFGFMLSNSPGNMGFELAPFKLPQEFIDILGGTRSLKFQQYRKLCKDAFIAVRKRWDLIVGLVEIMEKDSVLPCFTGHSVKPNNTPGGSVSQPATPSSGGFFGFLGGSGGTNSSETVASHQIPPLSANFNHTNPQRPVTVGSNLALPVSMKLKERFSLGMTEAQVKDFVDSLVDSSINSIMTRLYDAFQWYSNGVL
ncbi:Phosphatidylinositol 4-kinase pik1alpha (PI4-kinase)(PtdIns-4-kinase) [Physocladia obscura]|uniref:1-phosphatidylinositol 4-kinase n=1 Tax=Physocladia obscura TaxID=109957 RepID=A0AAD5T9P9_9FUNG|nr:Phosphatidylinositol 4-kinase pik1alpha (PI4-kinase)(PtdIns-4-kinase) [Physocladia obscura]